VIYDSNFSCDAALGMNDSSPEIRWMDMYYDSIEYIYPLTQFMFWISRLLLDGTCNNK
jgi:hypothetical protein